jgi:hypothetical protein
MTNNPAAAGAGGCGPGKACEGCLGADAVAVRQAWTVIGLRGQQDARGDEKPRLDIRSRTKLHSDLS